MFQRSHVASRGLVLVVCISFVQAASLGICDYSYGQYVETENKTLIQKTNDSLNVALDVCGGNDNCGFVFKTNGETCLFDSISYESYNDTGSPSYMYMKDNSTCKDFSSFPYIYGTFTQTASNKCPSSRRLHACSKQDTISDEATDCPTSDDQCCYDSAGSSGLKCTDSYLWSCDVPYMEGEIRDATTTSPSSSASGTDQHIIYVGEAVTITCDSGLMFSGDWTVDSNTNTVITCVLDSANEKTTNIKNTLSQGQCSETCNGANYDSTTTIITQEFPTRKYTEIVVKCKDGYGLQGGETEDKQECSTTEFTQITNCTRCEAPTDSAGASYDKNSTIPSISITQTCDSGYSIETTGDKTNTQTCRTSGFESDFPPCSRMCTLDLTLTGSNAHSVPGDVTELAYLKSIELSCPNGTLPVSQSSTLTCNKPGATITPMACDVECTTTGSVENGYAKINGSTAATQVAAGTTITADCKSRYAVWYGKATVFQCSSENYDISTDKFKSVPECLKVCRLEITTSVGDTLGQATVIVGTARNISNDDEVVKGETVNIPCKTEGETVINNHLDYQNLTCEENSVQLYASSCKPPCDTGTLTGVNNNTAVSPTPLVGTGSKVTFTCNSNYQLGEGDKTIESSLVTCNSSSMLYPSEVPVTSSCYGIPTMTAVGSGEKKIQTVLSLPIDYDRSQSSVVKVIFKDGSTEIQTLENVGGLAGTTGSQDTLLDLGAYSNSVTITAEVYYTGVTSPKTTTATSPTGPAPLAATASSVSVEFTGRTSVKVTVSGFTPDTIRSIYSSATIRADIYERTKKRAASPVYTMNITLDELSGTALSIPSDKLKEGASYSMTLTTVVDGGEGGSVSVDFDTGYDAPTVTDKVLTSTVNILTITLSSGAPQNANYTVTYTVGGTSADMTVPFTDGWGVLPLDGLSAQGEYTYTIVIKTSTGVSSVSQSITFTQGPTEPSDLENSLADMTDKSIKVTWTLVTNNNYMLELKIVSESTETLVATGNTTTGDFTFSELDAGVEYKVYIKAEMSISGNQYSSGQISVSITTYDCDVAAKKANFELYSSENVLLADLYLRKDATKTFTIGCVEKYEPNVASGETVDNTTACIGPNNWETFTDCKDGTGATKKDNDSDVVVGVVLGILAVVIIIAIILILIYRRNKRKSSSARYNPSAEEKKSTEKRDKEKDQGIEIDMDNVYMNEKTPEPEFDNDKRGTPDIPDTEPVEYDNNIADKGDNASQEVKIEFQDNEDEGEVHENKNADANV